MGGLVFCACGPQQGGSGDGVESSDSFIALPKDFDGYESWEPFFMPEGSPGSIHQAGPRTVYLSERPPAGSTSFPIGTKIVKEAPDHIFAMVKRSTVFNPDGAKGWQFFELIHATSGQVLIKWSGIGPPKGEVYGPGDDTCNTCHGAAVENDSVLAPGLDLKSL